MPNTVDRDLVLKCLVCLPINTLLIIITSAKEAMFLPVLVCLFVCLSVSKITQKVIGRIFLKF